MSYTGVRATPNNGGPPWCSGNTYAFGSYGWGPNGHIITVGHSSGSSAQSTSGLSYHTLHWDGDSLLFESNADGTVGAFFMDGHAGISNINGAPELYVNDYDLAGSLIDQRGSSTPHAVNLEDYPSAFSYEQASYPNAIPGPTAQDTSVVYYASASSATDGFITITGVRNYDQTASHWTSPDPVSGTPDDPMSQQPYLFNRNNPYSYSDPLGTDPVACNAASQAAFAQALSGGHTDANSGPEVNSNTLTVIGGAQSCYTKPIITPPPPPELQNQNTGFASSGPSGAMGALFLYRALTPRGSKFGITNNIVRRATEQARAGNIIDYFREFPASATRVDAFNAETSLMEDKGTLGNANRIRSIGPRNPAYDMAAGRAMVGGMEFDPGEGGGGGGGLRLPIIIK